MAGSHSTMMPLVTLTMVMLQLTSQSETGDIFGIEAIMLFGNKIVIYSTRTENNLKWEIYREG